MSMRYELEMLEVAFLHPAQHPEFSGDKFLNKGSDEMNRKEAAPIHLLETPDICGSLECPEAQRFSIHRQQLGFPAERKTL